MRGELGISPMLIRPLVDVIVRECKDVNNHNKTWNTHRQMGFTESIAEGDDREGVDFMYGIRIELLLAPPEIVLSGRVEGGLVEWPKKY